MQRLLEFILGLERGVLSQNGEFSLTFDPVWPAQQYVPAAIWNLALFGLICGLIAFVYRRDAGSRAFRSVAGALRLVLLFVVLLLLNRPMLSITQTRAEPSVLAVLIDDSLSMQVSDMGDGEGQVSRLAAVQKLLTQEQGRELRQLATKHQLRLYHFSGAAAPLQTVSGEADVAAAIAQIEALKPSGQSTRLRHAIEQVTQQLQGQRLAGIVVLTDGREMPATSAEASALPSQAVRIFPVPVGTESTLRNVAIRSVSTQDVAFKGDTVAIRVKVSVTGARDAGAITFHLKRADGQPLPGVRSPDITSRLNVSADGVYDVDLLLPAREVGVLDLVVEADKLPGEVSVEDNSRALQVSVLDAKVNLLYVEGYPRWEYRYLKTQMMRDKSVQISTLLTSADPDYIQEGDRPIRYFPQTMDQLLDFDVVLLGDVDPRQFTDVQLQNLRDFVMKKGGGFGMIAGPRYSPQAWRGTPVESILPVDIAAAREDQQPIEPFRPVLTAEGSESPIFRFFADRAANERYIRETLPPLYWFARGVSARPAVAEVYAEHPTLSGPDGRRAPLLVVGRPGAGRSLFSAIDDSWRWRYYTGESIFDTYWVQQIRYLARGKKVGQRRFTFASIQSVYELSEQVQLGLRVMDDALSSQLPDSLGVEVLDADGRLVAKDNLQRQPPRRDVFRLLIPAKEVGRFTARLPSIAAGVDAAQTTFDVIVPQLELSDPRPARSLLSQYAAQSDGKVIDLDKAAAGLLDIPSASRVVPVQTDFPLWSSPLLLGLMVLMLTAEWIGRKLAGLI